MMIRSVARYAAAVFVAMLPLHRAHAQPPAPRHAVLAVPAKYPSIQAAIDSAVPGDTVLVAPGRYYENIRFKGKGIVVASQFSRTRDAATSSAPSSTAAGPRTPTRAPSFAS
jgi:pectin methylesterase-like acyl-CoA thioesterase